MCSRFERILAYHCSPTLAGIKPSSLIALPAQQYADLPSILEQYAALLRCRGVFLEVLCQCQQRILLMVYRPEQLSACLNQPKTRAILRLCGYPVSLSLPDLIAHCSLRCSAVAIPF